MKAERKTKIEKSDLESKIICSVQCYFSFVAGQSVFLVACQCYIFPNACQS
jgi:hypothetical protein